MKEAWAIATGDGFGTFIGIYRFCLDALKPWHDGCRTALFRTRAEARAHLASVRGPRDRGLYPKAHVVRVSVDIRPALNERRRRKRQREAA